jgi:phospholipase/lecithinase/hemolysin
MKLAFLSLETLENRVVPSRSLVVFGDSLSDVGNLPSPTPPYYNGRWSNGPVWVDTLASDLGDPPLQPSSAGGTDYAWFGAQVAIPGFPPSIPQQISQYVANLAAAGQTIATNDVFAVWAGTNDYLGTFLGTNGPINPIDPATSASALTDALETLVMAGAKTLVVDNLPLLGNTPYIQATDVFYQQGGALVASANAWTTIYNSDVATGLKALSGANVVLVDLASLEEKVIQYPAQFGFTNTSSAVGPLQGGLITSITVSDPQDYFFFDGVHLTTQAQQLIGMKAAEDLSAGAPADVATHFSVTGLPMATAGNAYGFLVTALDQSGDTVPGYSGTVHITSSDTQAVLPADATLTAGVGFFAGVLKTAGNQTLTATDTTTSSIAGVSSAIEVAAAAANHFLVTAAPLPTYPGVPGAYPTVANAAASFASTGSPVVFTVVAEDPFGNIAPTYNGTVGFASTDTGAVLPANSTLSSGVGTFSATLATAGKQFLTATDITTPSITGASSAMVTRGLVVTSFAPTPSGFIITFNKPFNPSTVLMYTTGTTPDDIILATSNSQVSVRGSVLIDPTDTSLTFVKTDSISSAGTFNPSSGLLAAGRYTVTLRSLAAGNGFADALGSALDGTDTGHPGSNYGITFLVSAPPVAVGIPDFARGPSNTDAVFLPSTLTNGSTFALTYTNLSANPTTATATITFSTTAATLQNNIQAGLTSGGLAAQIGVNATANNTPNSVVIVTNDVSSGANVLVTFQSALAQATNQLLSSNTPGVSIAVATINAAQNFPGDGIPVALSNGLGVTSGSFTLQYNPNLLTISGAVSKAAGALFTLVSNNTVTGTAVLSLSSSASISSTATPIAMGSLLATVPLTATASYGAQQLLHISSVQLNGTAGPIAATNADAVEVAAYFGDVTAAGGPLSLGDATAVSSVASSIANTATQTIPGFAVFPILDPAIIGDVSLQGSVTSTDAGAMTQQVGGSARITIPYAPIGLPVALSPKASQQLSAHPGGSPVALVEQVFGNWDQTAFVDLDSEVFRQDVVDLADLEGYFANEAAKRGHYPRSWSLSDKDFFE